MKLEFDEETKINNPSLLYAKFQKSSETPSIILFLIKKHIVKDEASARRLLLTLVIFVFLISIYFFSNSFGNPTFVDKVR